MTDTVRAAMVVAQEESRDLGHNYVGNEHLLLGLLAQTDGMVADVLAGLGVSREVIVSRTREVVGTGPPRRWETLGVTPRLKRALELARAEARRLGHRCVGTEHVLLGIARLDEGVAATLLRELGAPPARIREEIATRLGIDPSQLGPPPRRRRRLLGRSRTFSNVVMGALVGGHAGVRPAVRSLPLRRHGPRDALLLAVVLGLEIVVDEVDDLEGDSHRARLVEALSEELRQRERILVLTAYIATSEYLLSGLRLHGVDAQTLMDGAALREARVGIVRDDSLESLALRDSDAVVHFDIPDAGVIRQRARALRAELGHSPAQWALVRVGDRRANAALRAAQKD